MSIVDMNKKLIAPAAALVALMAPAQTNTGLLHISDLNVNKGDSLLTLNMTVSPKEWRVPSNDIVTLTPLLVAGKDTVAMEPVRIAGRRAWYHEVRNGNELPRAGKTGPIAYSATVPFTPAFENSNIVLQADTASICNCNPPASGSRPIVNIDFRRRRPDIDFRYIVPNDTAEKIFNLSGRANVIFKVNRTDIDWNYVSNHAELDTILRTIDVVRNNPDATVRKIRLTGYASPEGPFDNNVRLADGRTKAVKRYVADHANFLDTVYATASVPEDWAGLRAYIEKTTMPDRDRMIAFIDDKSIPEARRNDLFAARFPEAYPFLLKNVYPTLRHTDYVITYKIRRYYDVAEIARVLKTNPRNLSLNELFLLANSYTQGSPRYDEVFITAARIYPESEIANLNAANSSINRGDYKGAAFYLNRLPDGGEKSYALGILATRTGNLDEALVHFRKASGYGVPQAAEAVSKIEEALKTANAITIL